MSEKPKTLAEADPVFYCQQVDALRQLEIRALGRAVQWRSWVFLGWILYLTFWR